MVEFVDKIGSGFPLDGYDNSPDFGKYQMVPLEGTRTLFIKTGNSPAKVQISRNPEAILIGRFQEKGGARLPGIDPTEMKNRDYELPANREIKFEVMGRQVANASINIDDTVSQGGITLPDGIIIGVKASIKKKMTFVYISDLLGDVKDKFTEKSIDPRDILKKANISFQSQLNMQLEEVDAGNPIREVSAAKNYGNPIVLDQILKPENEEIKWNIVGTVFKKFLNIFSQTHFVIFLTRPIRLIKDTHLLDMNIRFSTGTNVIFMTPFTSSIDELLRAFMHEVGHASGAEHVNERPSVMFPQINGTTMRFLAEHIEAIHHAGPLFPK